MSSIKPLLGIFFIVSLICFSYTALAETDSPPEIEWKQVFGRSDSEVANSIALSKDGGYLVIGTSKSYENGNIRGYLIKIDANGRLLLNKTYGESGGTWLYDMEKTPDGNYLLIGATPSFGSKSNDLLIIKVDDNGDVLWLKNWGTANVDAAFGAAFRENETFVTGYYSPFTSSKPHDLITYLLDESGNVKSYYTGGMNGNDIGRSVKVTSDGGFIVCGWSEKSSSGDPDLLVQKYFANGTEAWEYRFGGTNEDYGLNVIEAPDGGFLLGGNTNSYGAGKSDLYVIKLDSFGNMLWEKTYGGPEIETGTYMTILDDGYLLLGNSMSNTDKINGIYMVKIDRNGGIIWVNSYNDNIPIYGDKMLKTPDGGFILSGHTYEPGNMSNDVLVIKFKGTASPLAEVVEKAAPPVAAAMVGTSIGFIGIFLTKILGFINQLLGKPEKAINTEIDKMIGFVDGYIKSHIKVLLFRKESKIRKVAASQRPSFFAGFSLQEIVVSIVGSILLAIAYMFAKKANWLPETIIIYLFASGVAIILHDLVHRYLAWRYKAVTEYQFWGLGTIAMFATAILFGIVYAVPARTIVNNAAKMKPEELGIIYGAGPLLSFLIALVFAPLMFMGGWLATLGLIGFSANLVSATYSLMPFDPMDGNKVFKWNKLFWLAPFAIVLVIYVVSTILML